MNVKAKICLIQPLEPLEPTDQGRKEWENSVIHGVNCFDDFEDEDVHVPPICQFTVDIDSLRSIPRSTI